MRQAGILAAAGIHALENQVDRLVEDHANAARLARGLSKMPGLEVRSKATDTNIVLAKIRPGWGTAEHLEAGCREQGVLFHAVDSFRIRLVTHLDVGQPEIDRSIRVIHQELHAQRA